MDTATSGADTVGHADPDPMDPLTLAGLAVAGVFAGLIGYLTGMASLVSFPAMLAAGLTPVAANITQTLGLVGVGAGAASRTLPTLVANGPRALAVHLAVAAGGGFAGALLLLAGGEAVFAVVVPWLVLLAALMVLVGPRIRSLHRIQNSPAWVHKTGLGVISTYGGYFGAGSGTLYLALATLTTRQPFATSMLVKSVYLGTSNLAAALVFIAVGSVHWPAAIALGFGCVLGGRLSPIVVALLPEMIVRWIVAVGGVTLAGWLMIR